MNKFMLTIAVLASFSANARTAQERDTLDARKSEINQYCPQYNATAIQNIYKFLTANAEQIQKHAIATQTEKQTCDRLYKMSDLNLNEMQAYLARCEGVDKQSADASEVYTAAIEASKLTAALYESQLTTNSVRSCEANIQKVNSLKQLLNL